MQTAIQLVRPQRLEIGAVYLLCEEVVTVPFPNHRQVTFVGYDNCPAFVYVRTAEGYVGRCPRDDLFEKAVAEHYL